MGFSLREFAEGVMSGASAVFEEHGSLSPFFHAVDCEGESHILPAPFQDKNLSAAMARFALDLLGATRVAFVDEAWSVESKTDEDVERIRRQGVSQQNNRIEVVMVLAEDRDEGILQAYRKIIRDGDTVTLGPLEIYAATTVEGRFVGLLPKPKQGKLS